MGKQYPALSEKHIGFIIRQQMFFVATAAADGRINLSPKGMDSLRITAPNQVVWLNLTGSGNETAAHLREDGRMTLMFCAFEGEPKIVRVYGRATSHQEGSAEWARAIPSTVERPIPRCLPLELMKGSKMRSCAARSIPGPSSATSR